MHEPANKQRSTKPRLLRIGGAAALASLTFSVSRSAHAEPPPNPLLQCHPIACAAAYIGVPASNLSAAIVAETTRTGLPGVMVAIDGLTAAQQDKLAATGPAEESNQILTRFAIIATHDALRDLLLTWAVSGLVAAPGIP